jgi:hypothetical protein
MRTGSRAGRLARRLAVAIAVAVAIPVSSAAAAVAVVPAPNPGTSNTIGGLVAFSPTEVWGVGTASSASYAGCHGRTLTSRWNGLAFVEVAAPATPMCASVNGVAGRSTADIWAAGSTNNGRDTHLRHWDGSSWSAVAGATIPLPPSGGRRQRSTALNAVAAIASADVWAVGMAEFQDFKRYALIEHWTGSAWQLVPGPTGTGVLYGITALAPSNVWAVGLAGGSSGAQTLVTHWNGSKWTTVPSPNANLNNSLRGVAAVSATDVWAVGDSIKNAFDGVSVSKTLVERWNGTSWSIVPSPNVGAGNNVLTGIAARSASDVWAVGYDDDVTGSIPVRHTLWLHWNGVRWSTVASPNAGTGDNTLTGVIAPSATTDVWAWGGSASGTLVERFTA